MALTEADTCRKLVVPKLQAAGWDSEPHSIAEQRTITAGAIVPVAQGFTRFIELGPGTALSGFMKRIDKNAQMLNMADVGSLEKTAKDLAS